VNQLSRHREALRIGGGALVALCLVPGMPKIPFLLAGGVLILASTRSPAEEIGPRPTPGAVPMPAAASLPPGGTAAAPDPLSESLRVDPLELLLAPDLVDLVDPARGGDLLDRVRALRRKTALDLGLVLPPVRTRDGAQLPPGSYEIRIGGVPVATGESPPGHLLAIGDAQDQLPGRRTTEPVFGLPAVWVPTEHRATAEMLGATLVERPAVVTTHLAEMVRRNASRLLSLDDTRELLEALKADRPAAVEELVPSLLPLSSVQRVLQTLLDEQVSIRDLGRVLEGVGQRARATTDPDALLEAARAALGPALTAQYVSDGVLHAITVDPALEQDLVEGLRASEQGVVIALDPLTANRLAADLAALVNGAENAGLSPVLLVAGPLRLPLRRLIRGALPQLPVIGFAETAGISSIETVGQVSRGHEVVARG
jgi:flagellar biosynthesis protein FlhA